MRLRQSHQILALLKNPFRAIRFRKSWLIAAAICPYLFANAASYQVMVQDSFFEPDRIAIDIGDTVVWVGNGGQDHTITSDEGLFDSAELWSGIPFGEVFPFTFLEAGDYPYYCLNHGFPGGGGMAGTVVVSATSENQPPNRPVNQLPVNSATNQALTLQLRGSPFSDPDSQDFHAASQWIVRRASDSQIVYDSGEDSTSKTNRAILAGALADGTSYSWQVRYKDGRGAWSEYSAATTFSTLVPVVQEGIGLKVSYANSTNLDSPLAVATNALVNFDWGRNRPHRRITADDFSVRWEGAVLPQFTEEYQFEFKYRGRARLWVNNQLILDEWHGCTFPQSRRSSADLVAGQLTPIRVEYMADPSGAFAVLSWTSSTVPPQVVPTARLFPQIP